MNTLSSTTFHKYSEQDLLSSVLSNAVAQQQAAAVWRLPGSSATQVLVANETGAFHDDDFLEELDPGFLFCPFEKTGRRIFLRADHLVTIDSGRIKNLEGNDNASMQWLADQLHTYTGAKYMAPPTGAISTIHVDREAFSALVTRAVEEIKTGAFEKIVPSRTFEVELPSGFDIIEAFQKLCAAYPHALVSYVSIPEVGNWLGATPELLVSVEDQLVFKTVALAGTLPYETGIDVRSVAWTQKEIEEQALVERYVISCFKKIRLREYHEQGPRTVVAGNLMHLRSEFTVDMKATNFPQIGTVMLDLLHPTSAVCGMPLEPAMKFLKKHEPYDRGFYAGFLGPVNIHNNIELFVNIRCMQISGRKGVLYAGAGVTIDSVAEKEWLETEMKLRTLLNVLL